MKNSVFAFSLLLLGMCSAALLVTQEAPVKAAETDKPVPRELAGTAETDPRKLLMSFYWNSREKRYVQRERMKEMMKNSLKNLMERYQFEAHLDQWNHETLEDIHRQYNKAKSNIQLAKHFLIEKMDNIYNNFIQPARWFY
jgi:hypothetical protein